nr:unnamed protein product [Callosobruchus chinensis]
MVHFSTTKVRTELRLFFVKYDINVALIAPEDLTNDTRKRREAAKEIKSYFFNSASLITIQFETLSKFISDDQFNRPIRQTALEMRKYVDVYFYQFSYEGLLGRKTESIEPVEGQGVGHAEELGYLFTQPSISDVPENDTLIQKKMVRMWTNFVKLNNPTPTKNVLLQNMTWLPAVGLFDDMIYLNIDLNSTMALNPFSKDMKFYDEIYQKYGSPPYDTY